MSQALPSVLTGDRLPTRLRDLRAFPRALFLRGELPRGPAVAIVGTRTPTPEGLAFAEDLAKTLAAAGVAILSGGAKGIDTAAHRGALAAGGVSVIVAPAGYRVPFPPENLELFQRVVQKGGAYVSLVPDDQVARRPAFFARNACLVALSHAVVLVQAPLRSGARNAVAHARRLGRPLLVVPSSPWVSCGRGCLLELRAGALLCESARDVLTALQRQGLEPVVVPERRARSNRRPSIQAQASLPGLSQPSDPESANVSEMLPLERAVEAVLQAMEEGATHPDELCQRLGLPAAQIQHVLLTLRLRGVLVPDPRGGFERT